MNFTVKSVDISTLNSACLLIPVFEGGKLSTSGKTINKASKGYQASVLKNGDLTGKNEQTLILHQIVGIKAARIILVGFGEQKKCTTRLLNKVLPSLTVGAVC